MVARLFQRVLLYYSCYYLVVTESSILYVSPNDELIDFIILFVLITTPTCFCLYGKQLHQLFNDSSANIIIHLNKSKPCNQLTLCAT